MLEAAIMIAAGIFILAIMEITVLKARTQGRQIMRTLGQSNPLI